MSESTQACMISKPRFFLFLLQCVAREGAQGQDKFCVECSTLLPFVLAPLGETDLILQVECKVLYTQTTQPGTSSGMISFFITL